MIDYSAGPDHYRMTLGEHLDELRKRLVFALVGFGLALAACFFFGRDVMGAFCAPLLKVLLQNDIPPQVYFTSLSDPFVVYMKICFISAASIASPWIIWQVWLFVAAGLYPKERKMITRYVPLSITLLIGGMLFVYFLVLPWTIQFFMAFNITIPLPNQFDAPTVAATTQQMAPGTLTHIEAIPGNPADLSEFRVWFDTTQRRLKMIVDGKVRVIQFGPENLTAPMITLPDYIDLVLGMLLTFGLSFQMPLVVLAVATLGLLSVPQLREFRRVIYLIMAVLAAAITPGDVITATVALMLPLIGLYELGIWLARGTEKVRYTAPGAE